MSQNIFKIWDTKFYCFVDFLTFVTVCIIGFLVPDNTLKDAPEFNHEEKRILRICSKMQVNIIISKK